MLRRSAQVLVWVDDAVDGASRTPPAKLTQAGSAPVIRRVVIAFTSAQTLGNARCAHKGTTTISA